MAVYYSFCTASLTSQTLAQKAQRFLYAHGIDARIVKLDANKSMKGCAYGVEFPCAYLDDAKRLLHYGGIEPKHFYSGDTEV